MELGRSGRTMMMSTWRRRASAASYGVIGNRSAKSAALTVGALALARAATAATAALNDHQNLAAFTLICALSRAREALAYSSEL